MKFIDLFAGLGGFHIALRKLGHKCVFASEIDKNLAELYNENFKIAVSGDIRKIKPIDIPKHDILCAGFPCQPFSKAGKQKGMEDKKNGDLFQKIIDILRYHKPKYFILENVPHIKQHDNEKTWKSIVRKLKRKQGYEIDHKIISPHEFGIPQHRKRIFIIGSKNGLKHFNWPEKNKKNITSILSILEKKPIKTRKIGTEEQECIKLWQEFIDKIPLNENLPSFPIWSMEFDADYPFEDKTPHIMTDKELSEYRGSFGTPLKGLSKEEQLKHLPSYARTKQKRFPEWKRDFIRRNREFLKKYSNELRPVIENISRLDVPSWQKLEWNCQKAERIINNYLLQFRPSGLRVKKINFAPSLVCTNTQIPIIGWENRYITKKEGAKLQSISGIKLPENEHMCFEALGNAVNAHIVNLIAESLIK
jgi:DNA (cytosine-5)-methyltransferase 1